MADKYQHRIEAAHLIVIIPSGPAAGEHKLYMPKPDADGNIFLAVIEVGGKRVNLKIKASENSEMLAAYWAAFNAREAEHAANEATRERTIEEKMAAAGFEQAGNAGELWNRLNPVRGENF